MVILGCDFDINFCISLAPGSSLSNTSKTKLHVWNESCIIVEFMGKFIWKHNFPIEFYGTLKMSPERLFFWCSKSKKWDPPETPKLKVREVSQIGFSNISLHPTSVPSFSQIGWPNFWPLEHFLRQWHLNEVLKPDLVSAVTAHNLWFIFSVLLALK